MTTVGRVGGVGQNAAMLRALSILVIVIGFLSPAAASAQDVEPDADPYLAAAVMALGENDPALGLQLIDKAATRSTDPRIGYYRAFALEKLGRCRDARRAYTAAQTAGPARYAAAATAALRGFDARCVAQLPPPTVAARGGQQSPTLVTLGWVLTTVGALTLIAVPLKITFDHRVAEQSEQYFKKVFECEVDFGDIASGCDEAELKSNEQWTAYEKRIQTARRANVWMLASAGVLLAGGITSIAVGARRVRVALVPRSDGAVGSLAFDF